MGNHKYIIIVLVLVTISMIFSSCNHYVGDREYIEYLDLYIEYEQCESYVSFKFKNKGDEEESTIKFYDLKKLPSIYILNNDTILIVDKNRCQADINKNNRVHIVKSDVSVDLSKRYFYEIELFDSGCGYHILNSDSIEIYSYGGIPQLKLIHSLEKMKY